MGVLVNSRSRWILYSPWAIAAVYALISVLAAPSYALTVFGDVSQLILVIFLSAIFALNAKLSQGRARWFWLLMMLGGLFWTSSQGIWSYYELLRRQEAPSHYLGDVVLFLHLAPMIAALAVQPHKQTRIPRLSALSLAMIATWWLFLYAFLVIPWQYIQFEAARYGNAYNALYAIEGLVFIGGLGLLTVRSHGQWRKLYLALLVGSIVYTVDSQFVSALIQQRQYYTGSPTDLLFLIPVTWIAFSSARLGPCEKAADTEAEERDRPRVGTMLALASVPCLLIWNTYSTVPPRVRAFRSLAGLLAIILLAALLFAKQHILANRLTRSLQLAKASLAQLSLAQKQLEHQATHDAMTGLLNRSTILMCAERELARSLRENMVIAALLVDLDHFKNINDTRGHHAGDVALSVAATRMQQAIRSHDFAGRYGGEEFLILISDCDRSTALEIAERIRTRIEEDSVTLDGRKLSVTATIGVALSEPQDNTETLLRRTDAALYVGKQHGRNVVSVSPATQPSKVAHA